MASDATSRSEIFPSGIATVGLGEVKREIPADEPSPLAPNALLAVIGKPVPRQNGRAKVSGDTRFTVDVALPGMLHGRILRAALPHAEVRAVDRRRHFCGGRRPRFHYGRGKGLAFRPLQNGIEKRSANSKSMTRSWQKS